MLVEWIHPSHKLCTLLTLKHSYIYLSNSVQAESIHAKGGPPFPFFNQWLKERRLGMTSSLFSSVLQCHSCLSATKMNDPSPANWFWLGVYSMDPTRRQSAAFLKKNYIYTHFWGVWETGSNSKNIITSRDSLPIPVATCNHKQSILQGLCDTLTKTKTFCFKSTNNWHHPIKMRIIAHFNSSNPK